MVNVQNVNCNQQKPANSKRKNITNVAKMRSYTVSFIIIILPFICEIARLSGKFVNTHGRF